MQKSLGPHTSQHAMPAKKDPALDKDKEILLTHDVAQIFADSVNQRFAKQSILVGDEANEFVNIITSDPLFPFKARLENGIIVVSPQLNEMTNPVLKDISDGVTEINKAFAKRTNPAESKKFALAILFHPAIRMAYVAAGMADGAHSKYTARAC